MPTVLCSPTESPSSPCSPRLIIVFDANLTSLIQLYLVGVFISFTPSRAGMVVHRRRARETAAGHRIFTTGFGAAVTGIVFVVVVMTKFGRPPDPGACIVVAAIPILIWMMRSMSAHYRG